MALDPFNVWLESWQIPGHYQGMFANPNTTLSVVVDQPEPSDCERRAGGDRVVQSARARLVAMHEAHSEVQP
jgi:hypothetical protein